MNRLPLLIPWPQPITALAPHLWLRSIPTSPSSVGTTMKPSCLPSKFCVFPVWWFLGKEASFPSTSFRVCFHRVSQCLDVAFPEKAGISV